MIHKIMKFYFNLNKIKCTKFAGLDGCELSCAFTFEVFGQKYILFVLDCI